MNGKLAGRMRLALLVLMFGTGALLLFAAQSAHETMAQTTGPCVSPPSGMVAWWPLDGLNLSGEYDDLAGGDNNGTPIGNPSPIPTQYVGNSLQAGTGKYVEVTDAPNLNFGLGSFTIDAWVRFTPGTQTEPIVYKLASPSGSGGGYFLYLANSTFGGPADRLDLQIGSQIFQGPQVNAPIGTWIFVAATVNKTSSSAGTVSLYVGVPSTPLAIANNPAGAFNASSPFTPLWIGRWPSNPHASLGIDELEVFQVVYRQGTSQRSTAPAAPASARLLLQLRPSLSASRRTLPAARRSTSAGALRS